MMKRYNIKRFSLEGMGKDRSKLFDLRDSFQRLLTEDMRQKGYVPLLDFGPLWNTEYNPRTEKYYVDMSVYGIYVGKAKSWTIEGISAEGKLLPRIPKNK